MMRDLSSKLWQTQSVPIIILCLFLADNSTIYGQRTKIDQCQYFEDVSYAIDKQLHTKTIYNNSADEIDYIGIIFHQVLPQSVDFFTIEAIRDQIDHLNAIFRRQDYRTNNLPKHILEVLGSSTIQFYLADINRHQASLNPINVRTNIDRLGFRESLMLAPNGGSTPIAQNRYLNVYICELDEDVHGYAGGVETIGTDSDIVVVDYRRFNVNGLYKSTGNTLAHEIGHYFGLSHPWGEHVGDCSEGDEILDTPMQSSPNYTCELTQDSCSKLTVGRNLMDYSPDVCGTYITKGQADKMKSTLSTLRSELIDEPHYDVSFDTLIDISIYPNPATSVLRIKLGAAVVSDIRILDSSGRLIDRINLNDGLYITTIDLQYYKPGSYTVLVNTSGNVQVLRFAKI